jgi:uncharacterized membrane protein
MEQKAIGKARLEAFSDAVIAIILTIMVLELKVPEKFSLQVLIKLTPIFLSYLLSFLVIAIMWINHHHIFHILERVNTKILWFNMKLLFWMSLIPFVTGVLGEGQGEALSVALYGLDLAMCALAFLFLRLEIAKQHRHNPELTAIHSQAIKKVLLSVILYTFSVFLAYISVYLSYFIFILIPALYFLPEKKIVEHFSK